VALVSCDFQTAKLRRGYPHVARDRLSAGIPDYPDFPTCSIFRGTGQPPTRRALLTAKWRWLRRRPNELRGVIRSFRRTLIVSGAGRRCLEQPQQLFNFSNLCLDKFLREQLLRPTRGERKAGKK